MPQKYKLLDDGVVRDDGATIPATMENRDWVEYQEWLTAGNTPDPMDVPPEPTRDEVVHREIIDVWPMDLQVEALVESATTGDSSELDKLKAHIADVKQRNPYVAR